MSRRQQNESDQLEKLFSVTTTNAHNKLTNFPGKMFLGHLKWCSQTLNAAI